MEVAHCLPYVFYLVSLCKNFDWICLFCGLSYLHNCFCMRLCSFLLCKVIFSGCYAALVAEISEEGEMR